MFRILSAAGQTFLILSTATATATATGWMFLVLSAVAGQMFLILSTATATATATATGWMSLVLSAVAGQMFLILSTATAAATGRMFLVLSAAAGLGGAVDQHDGVLRAGYVHAAVEPCVKARDSALDGADNPRVVRTRRFADQHEVPGRLHDLGPQRAELLRAEEGERARGRGVVGPVVGVVVEVGR